MFLYPGKENFPFVQLGEIHRVDRAQTARKYFLAGNEGTVCTPHHNKISMITLHRVDRAQGARIFSLASNCGHTLLYTVTHTVFQ